MSVLAAAEKALPCVPGISVRAGPFQGWDDGLVLPCLGCNEAISFVGRCDLLVVPQVHVFEAQMALAARLRRPVSVHCVKAYGRIVQMLQGKAMEIAPAKDATRKGTKDVGGTGRIERETRLGGGEGECADVVEGAHRLPPRIALQ